MAFGRAGDILARFGRRGKRMNWASALRADLASQARDWAKAHHAAFYESRAKEDPTVLFEASSDRKTHGNFLASSWQAIRENPEWRQRLEKPHSQKQALPEEKRAQAKELDSCNSSDAILMNCFCYPGAGPALLGVSGGGSAPHFGFKAKLRLEEGLDSTEIDMLLGDVIVEAKLTETDFTAKPEAQVSKYASLASCFDVETLPRENGSFAGYQLIRNVIAAHEQGRRLVVLIDLRRPDLLQEWWRVHSSIRDTSLRLRCGFRTWQEVAAASPAPLRDFLHEKYGL
jgi:hypothetical protein